MAYIKVNFGGAERDNAALKKTLARMAAVESELSQLSGQLDSTLQSRRAIAENLRACRAETSALLFRGSRLHATAVSAVRAYRNTETALNREALESAAPMD